MNTRSFACAFTGSPVLLLKVLLPLDLLLLAPAPARAQAPQRPAVLQIGIPVRDLPVATRFYTEVLGCQVVDTTTRYGSDEERLLGVFGVHTESTRLRLGDEVIELTEFLAPRGRDVPADGKSNDLWFQHIAIVVRDMDVAYATLRRHRVRHASPLPQTLPDWNPNAGGIRAFYFQDPDGHPLEVLQFPPGKGDAKWHRPGTNLFLGIDHTAIAVADTERSLRFWRDALGLEVTGTSDNHGIEQDRLNNVFGAHLRITTLRGANGPGVELLEYLTPRGGRPMPAGTAANDLWAWSISVRTGPLSPLLQSLPAALGAPVSPRPCPRPSAEGNTAHFLVGDPDGHRALLVEALPTPGPTAR